MLCVLHWLLTQQVCVTWQNNGPQLLCGALQSDALALLPAGFAVIFLPVPGSMTKPPLV